MMHVPLSCRVSIAVLHKVCNNKHCLNMHTLAVSCEQVYTHTKQLITHQATHHIHLAFLFLAFCDIQTHPLLAQKGHFKIRCFQLQFMASVYILLASIVWHPQQASHF